MSKMEPYRDFKVSIYHILKTFNGNEKPDIYLDRMNGEARVISGVGYVCLRVKISKKTVQRQPH